MKLEEFNPFIRYAKVQSVYDHRKENSICYDCRLFYVIQGSGIFFANGHNYTVSPSFTAFLPPKSQYRFIFSNNNIKIYTLNFDLTDEFHNIPKVLGTATENSFDSKKVLAYELPQNFSNAIIQSNAITIQNHIAKCIELFTEKIPYYKYFASAHLKLALFDLLCRSKNDNEEYRLIQSIQEFIRNNYQNAELDNSTIAEQFNYHSYHLNRLMKIHTKQTLHEYLTQYRLHMAKNYLTTTMLNVTAIAEKSGFASYTYFIKVFRERTGLSPLQYRKTHKNFGF